MYKVSDAYKLAVADSHRKSKIRAVLKVGNTVMYLDDNEILKNTVYVTNQCTNGNEYEYGCVYSGECGITIKSAVDRYSLYGAELKLYWSLLVSDSTWEEIPLGVFYVSEPNRINDKISIKALDGMTLLDISVKEDTQGTLVELLHWIANKCNVELAQTDKELNTLINSNVQYSVYADKVDTYRDLLAYLCMMSACFGTFDRNGRLKVTPYACTHSVELTRKQRFGNATFSDYTTEFAGVKARFIAEENYAPYEVVSENTGLVLDMGDNPIVRGLPGTKRALLDEIYNVLKDVSYTPFEIETLGNPALDLGDLVVNKGVGKEGKAYVSPVTYSYWTYRDKHKLRGVGGNPKLSGINNKQNKQLNSLESEILTKNVVIKHFSNSDVITFKDIEKNIAKINYSVTENCQPILLLTLRVETSLDGVLVLQFYTDGLIEEGRTYRHYVEKGEHIVTLADIYDVEANERHTVEINAQMEYTESDIRLGNATMQTCNNFLNAINTTGAKIASNLVVFPEYKKVAVNEEVATANIKAGGVNAILYGQGIAAGGKWDGNIIFTEELARIPFNSSLTLNVTGSVESKMYNPKITSIAEALKNRSFNSGLAWVDSEPEPETYDWNVLKQYTWQTVKSHTWEELRR